MKIVGVSGGKGVKMALNYILIGKKIREFRKMRQISQSTLSEMADLSPGYISYIENGSKIPSLDTIVHIANALEITPDVLLESELVKKERTIAAEYAEIMDSCTMLEKEIVLECSRNLVEVLKKNKIVSKVH